MGKGLDESGKIIRNLAYEQYTMISLADSNQTANEEEMEKKSVSISCWTISNLRNMIRER